MAIDIVYFFTMKHGDFPVSYVAVYQRVHPFSYWCVAFYVGLLDGLLGDDGIIIDSDDWDDSRKFPA